MCGSKGELCIRLQVLRRGPVRHLSGYLTWVTVSRLRVLFTMSSVPDIAIVGKITVCFLRVERGTYH